MYIRIYKMKVWVDYLPFVFWISTWSVAAPLLKKRSRIASVGDYLLITTLESRYRTQTTSISGTRETDFKQTAAWFRLTTSIRRYIMSLEWVRLFTSSIFFAMVAEFFPSFIRVQLTWRTKVGRCRCCAVTIKSPREHCQLYRVTFGFWGEWNFTVFDLTV